jgi:hypothetical protein
MSDPDFVDFYERNDDDEDTDHEDDDCFCINGIRDQDIEYMKSKECGYIH